ncbi:hypothetical protein [Plantactinospora sp. KBS50]|uniref:hypothetical protein n=1 Tax=Plantactinospora sp. KBS50 TaxID=2024580 RepID=UPI0018DF297B|nr:hypothetical protein [Plantactinospora sp. KBS50]
MDVELIVMLAAGALWLTAGLLVDGLPRHRTAAALARWAGAALGLGLAGAVATAAAGFIALTASGTSPAGSPGAVPALPALPALAVAASTLPRLRRLRAGAAALVGVPDAPVPPALRAAAAHPLVGLPPQLAALAGLPAVVIGISAVVVGIDAASVPGGPLLGPASTVALLAVVTIGVRQALRHNRLAERASAAFPLRNPAAGGPYPDRGDTARPRSVPGTDRREAARVRGNAAPAAPPVPEAAPRQAEPVAAEAPSALAAAL